MRSKAMTRCWVGFQAMMVVVAAEGMRAEEG